MRCSAAAARHDHMIQKSSSAAQARRRASKGGECNLDRKLLHQGQQRRRVQKQRQGSGSQYNCSHCSGSKEGEQGRRM